MTNDSSARMIQKMARGYLSRKEIKIKTIYQGVIHIQIRGNAASLERFGIFGIDPERGSRAVDILSIRPDLFYGRVIGGDKLFNVVKVAPFKVVTELDFTSTELLEMFGPHTTVYINGGFFNSTCYYKDYPEYATIGSTKTSTNMAKDIIPIPEEYKNDYACLVFNDGSYVSSAPLFSSSGKVAYDANTFKAPQYQFKTLNQRGFKPCPPGALFHAGDPNPRAGISLPGKESTGEKSHLMTTQNRTRIAVATATSRGSNSNGFTMFEWGNTMTRLSRLNRTESSALNLDGGASVVMGVINEGKKIFEVSQNSGGRDASTLIVFSAK